MKIYLARQISGLSYDEVVNEYKKTIDKLKGAYDVLCPMIGKQHLQGETSFAAYGKYTHPVSIGHAIFERDKWMVSQSDIVFADFTGTEKPSIGMTMELAWASLLNKHTVIVLPAENCHTHCFIREGADIVFENYEDAIKYLINLSGDL
jgi:hypothetical protein